MLLIHRRFVLDFHNTLFVTILFLLIQFFNMNLFHTLIFIVNYLTFNTNLNDFCILNLLLSLILFLIQFFFLQHIFHIFLFLNFF